MNFKQKMLSCAVVPLLLGGVSACGSSSGSSGATKTVGLVADLTGPLSFLGKPYLDVVSGAMKAAGYKVVSLDTQGQTAAGVSDARQLVNQDHVAAIFGPILTSDCDAVASVATTGKTPLFCPAPDPAYVVPPRTYVFGAGTAETQDVPPMLAMAKTLIHGTTSPRVGVFYLNVPGSVAFNKAVAADAGQIDGKVVTSQVEQITTVDMSTIASTIASAHPDVIVGDGNATSYTSLVKALRADGSKAPLLIATASGGYAVIQGADDPQVYTATHWDMVDPTTTQSGAAAYVKAMKSIGVTSPAELNGQLNVPEYTATQMLVSAQKTCSCGGKALASQLEKTVISLPGLVDSYRYSTKSHEPALSIHFYRWDSAADKPAAVGSVSPVRALAG